MPAKTLLALMYRFLSQGVFAEVAEAKQGLPDQRTKRKHIDNVYYFHHACLRANDREIVEYIHKDGNDGRVKLRSCVALQLGNGGISGHRLAIGSILGHRIIRVYHCNNAGQQRNIFAC